MKKRHKKRASIIQIDAQITLKSYKKVHLKYNFATF